MTGKEVVVAQLVEQSLSIPEVRGSNPVIGKIYIEHLFTINCFEKTKINKRGREWPTLKKIMTVYASPVESEVSGVSKT